MKLTTFTYQGTTRLGVVLGDEVLDAATVPDLPQDMIGLLEAGAEQSVEAFLQRLDRTAEEIGLQWPEGISAVQAVHEVRREL